MRIGNPAITRNVRGKEPTATTWWDRLGVLCLILAATAILSPAQDEQALSPTFTTLHSFEYTDGAQPGAAPLQATNGTLYGTALHGGSYGAGTVFKITTGGKLTVLYSFCAQNGCPDGMFPFAGLIEATDGNLYGTTYYAGANGGGGTVFRITPNGTETTLYSFCSQSGCTDGSSPQGGVVQGTDGNFYGTTFVGGANGVGTVFKLTPAGALTTLHSFCSQSGCTDGFYPSTGLIQGIDGNLYGTTTEGGLNDNCSYQSGCGTIFRITPGGLLTTLYNFCPQFGGCLDGYDPVGSLLQGTNGSLYGTAYYGGANGNYGTIFSFAVGMGPFVETLPTSGTTGSTVQILGTNLTGATGVSFNGTSAVFTVLSKTLISATVPAGATTGFVTVITPGGTLKSNVKFQVRP
jgi:uncharacterized repeat protein (TIGR03803 family)